MEFKSVEELEKHLKVILNGIMEIDVAEDVIDTLGLTANDVYNAYSDPEGLVPVKYKRGYTLLHPEMYESEMLDDYTVKVTTLHRYGELIEYGHGVGGAYEHPYNKYGTAWQFLQPRPWFATARAYLADQLLHDTVANGFREWGITVL